ncbi:MAG: cytosine deaminase [Chloroflexi bacterium]|nr:cytosine deaminase [Chloroflexota bacterium]
MAIPARSACAGATHGTGRPVAPVPRLDAATFRGPHSLPGRTPPGPSSCSGRSPLHRGAQVAPAGLFVRNARIHPTTSTGEALSDLAVDGDTIAAIAPAGALPPDGRPELDAAGCLLSPPLVDPHVHMDAVLTVGEPRYNESGTLIEGIFTWAERKPSLTHADVKARALEAIRWEVAQGTGLIRSHVDVCDPNLVALKALLELREEVRDIVDLRLIAFPQDGILSFPNGKELMREAMRLGCDVIGGIPHYEWTRDDGVEEVHFLFDLARETGAPIDLHCDETDDEQSRFLEVVAARTMRDGMEGRVVAGHTTAMGSYNDNYAFKLIQILRRAGVTIVANPLDNIVLQGRFDTYPKRRGMTRVKELDAAGINVACGHDSIMDPWYPLGRGSMLDALSMLVHVAQMTGRAELFRAYEMVTTNPARAAEVPWGVKEGLPANFVVFDCADEAEAVRLRPAARWVVRGGRIVAETEPARSVIHRAGSTTPVSFIKPGGAG